MSSTHVSEDDLTLYFYGEGRRRADIEVHLGSCGACAATYREIATTLTMIAIPEGPERSDDYGREVWQRIRYKLPERDERSWMTPHTWRAFIPHGRSGFAVAAALLVIVVGAAFVAGRAWPRHPAGAPSSQPAVATQTANGAPVGPGSAAAGDIRQRILLTSVADHLDRSERVLTDIMNAPDRSDISSEQRWADDLLTTSRLYRQNAMDAGEQSVAAMLDELERSLLEIVNSPSKISAADLEEIRRRIDAAALLFKVRIMSDELRAREDAPDRSAFPRTSTRKTS